MFNAFRKDIFREIKNTFGRFAAIFAIVLLGVSFFTGIGSTGLDMKISGDEYFRAQNLMDIRVVSTYGINGNDIAAIKGVEGVEAVFPAYNIDALVGNRDSQIIVKVHGLDISPENAKINCPLLASGEMPLADNEAVAERGFANSLGLSVGDAFTLESGKKGDLRDSLRNVRFRLVGIVNSPYYVSNAERGSSSIGSGASDYYVYIPQSNFRRNVYSEAFVAVEGARALPCYGKGYEDLVKAVKDRLEDLGDVRVSERYIEATDAAWRALEAADSELSASAASSADDFGVFFETIADARKSLAEAKRDLVIQSGGLYDGARELGYAKDRLRSGISALDDAEASATAGERELGRNRAALTEAISSLDVKSAGLAEKEALLRAYYMEDPYGLSGYIDEIKAARASLAKTRESLQGDYEAAGAGEAALRAAREDIAARRGALLNELDALIAGEGAISDAEVDIFSGYASVYRGVNDLDRQYQAVEEQETDALKLVTESLAGVKSAEKTLDEMDRPKWYVMDRDSNPGYSGFFGDADKVEAIGKVFPSIFFVVAALVSLTTMTRLVEERRTEIGTLKSLGYGDAKIMSKYIIYAALPTVLGGVIGGAVGMRFFPVTIIMAYKSLYAIPDVITVMNKQYWIIGVAIGALSTLSATAAACSNELRASPAILMRPKPPKRGARVFLESAPFIWKRVKFIWKVTIRNIIRYRKRFWMTLAGIAGCMALLLTGFGLRDSIEAMINLQYGEVNLYDLTVSFSDTAKKTDLDSVRDLLDESPIVRGSMRFRQKQYDAGSLGGGRAVISVNLIVPEDAEAFADFTVLRDRATHEKYKLAENQVMISEKLSKHLALGRGDSFYIQDGDAQIEMTVSGIAENYYMHYVYMPPGLYARLFGGKPEYNAMYALLGKNADDQKQLLANDILDKKGVAAIFFTSSIFRTFNRVLGSLNFVVVVLIVSAAALAIVVLLNLTNINLSERKRELATIEVLGFFDKEVSAYVYRENVVLTLLGAAAGLGLGAALHSFVILTAETDIMMFGRRIKTESYIYSTLLTFLFSSFVNILTARKLRAINMVEALKSVE